MDPDKIIDAILDRKAALPILALTIFAGILVLASDPFLSRLVLLDFRDKYRPVTGAVFLVGSIYLIVFLVQWIGRQIGTGIKSLLEARRRRQLLTRLTEADKRVLRDHVNNDMASQRWYYSNETVLGLEHIGILAKLSDRDSSFMVTYRVVDWAWEHIKKQPDTIKANNPEKTQAT